MCDLKAAGDAAETIELGREFQTETTRFEKKLLRMFNLASMGPFLKYATLQKEKGSETLW